eukprot:TRINITY_DN13168_c0_g1_i1.p1 TRINITY_DN13168_c0_g1~~TRINITY_DN13168_c0_g1_i1.p1  ORF type:complete len:658 (-),score=131.48 TRINITY_DN13168_c0_g1_i1:88-2061(-)
MADRVERMMAREKAMKEKEAAKKAEQMAARQAKTKKFVPKGPRASDLATDKPFELENFQKLRKNLYAPLPKTERGKPVLIGDDPGKGESIIYCVGSDVIMRNLRNPLEADIYTEHPRATCVARFSPDGNLVASTDITGMVRVWNRNPVGGEPFKIELERPSLGGTPMDLAWGPESKRIAVVGKGNGMYGGVFYVSGGNACGTISGHSKTITSVAFRQSEPWSLVTVGEDLGTSFLNGKPFKWQHSNINNTRYPNCVRFNPSGSHFCVVAQDKKIWIGDGTSGLKTSEFELAHKGGVYACSWSPDGQQILTCSGDKTSKIWDVNSGKVVTSFAFGNTVDDQQLGCVWQGEFLVSLSLGGQLKYLDPRSGKITQVVTGHQKEIKSCTYHAGSNSIYTGSYTSRMVRWDVSSGATSAVETGHSNSIIATECQGDDIYTTAFDDTYRISKGLENTKSMNIGARPFNMGTSRGTAGISAIGTYDEKIHLVKNGAIVDSASVNYRPVSLAVSPSGNQVAVGGNDKKVHLFSVSGGKLSETAALTGHVGQVSALSYSADGKKLATAATKIIVFSTGDNSVISDNDFIFHTAKVNNMEWSPNGRYLASVGLDTTLLVWDSENPKKKMWVKAAHHGAVNDCTWIDDNTVASVGADAALKTWNLEFA